ncbi:hypothetical protein RUM44_002280 [Polyplax serrata]|uniref:Uncharacterized protein n=1 Tax=Polyplax serrata TaxID=468196 RepID=A0ABR1AMG8_POLSC
METYTHTQTSGNSLTRHTDAATPVLSPASSLTKENASDQAQERSQQEAIKHEESRNDDDDDDDDNNNNNNNNNNNRKKCVKTSESDNNTIVLTKRLNKRKRKRRNKEAKAQKINKTKIVPFAVEMTEEEEQLTRFLPSLLKTVEFATFGAKNR